MKETEDDLPPGLDPDHPCPKCGATPWAPVDGVMRLCGECHWYWNLIDGEGKHFELYDDPSPDRGTGNVSS